MTTSHASRASYASYGTDPYSPEPDYGTPAVGGASTAHVTIDGIGVDVAAGTSVLRAAKAEPDEGARADLARGFQDAAIEVLTAKTAHAVAALGYPTAMIGGGVACNRTLAGRLAERLAGRARVSVASPRLNTDNAAMIAAAGAWRLARGERSGWDLEPRDDLPLPGLVLSFDSTGSGS